MPTYEYECSECGHVFERFQGINEDPIRVCPECRGSVRRLISSGGGLVFKGPGFYATDYRSGSRDRSDSGTRKESHEGASDSSPKEKSDKNVSD
jgi:putative FmdB family regulatory protein